jgi:hypothetical protein
MSNHTSHRSRRHFLTQASTAIAALALLPFAGLGALAQKAKWGNHQLIIDLEINQPGFGRYNRPYIAVWIEDGSGQSVRTLALWLQKGKGSRWVPELLRWFNGERQRQRKNAGDLVETLSSPTRNPGMYQVLWDGKDDKGLLLDQGEYYLCVEAAREHGSYQLIREKLAFTGAAFSKKLAGNQEIKGIGLEYH